MGPVASPSSRRRALVERAVREWTRQLIDLTGRNQLLYYRTLKRGTLELTGATPSAVNSLLAGGSVRLSNLFPPTSDAPDRFNEALKRARTVHGKALTYFEERGIDTLYLAHGMATWTTNTSQSAPSAPVLLRPLRLDPSGAAASDFKVCLHGDWEVNEALLHLLATQYDIHLDGDALIELLDHGFGTEAPDPTGLFERLCKEAAEVPDFDIVRRIVVGTFAYTKLPMVKDLQANVDALADHDLIAAIAGDEGAQATVREQGARDVHPSLPDRTSPSDEFLILDADASQNLAINAALGGESLIVQGPPGTGKSQTIANLITSMTARGKRVLFVAEKRAAIEAVTKRFRKVGLGDLVLDLHGGVTSKKQLAADLAHTLSATAGVPHIDVTDLHHRLETSRAALTHHATALHERRDPWELSIFKVNEELIGLGDKVKTTLRFAGSRLEDLDADTVRRASGHLEELARLAEPLISGASPWAGTQLKTEGDAREVFDLVSGLAHDTVPAARTQLDAVLAQTGLPTPATVEDWRRTLMLLTELTGTLALVSPAVFELDLDDMVEALTPGGRGRWSRMIAHLFNSRYRAAKRTVRELWAAHSKPNGARQYKTVLAARAQARQWTELGGEGLPRPPEHLADATDSYDQLTSQLAALGAHLVSSELSRRPHRELGADVNALLADQQTLFKLPRIHELETWLNARHLAPLLQAVRDGEVDTDEVVDVFRHAWLSSIRTHVVSRDPRLANFDGKLQTRRVQEFRDADKSHLEHAAVRVRRAVAEQAIGTGNQHPSQDRLVRREANKKSRHLTLRKLFEQAPDVLTALRPCWAMSPLAVSQTLPAMAVFDVVIFDEASQVQPADAVPALLRAPQAVIAGDRRQLPPTTFFDMSIDDGDDGDEDDADDAVTLTAGFESVLDVLNTLLSNRMLTWHYRSEDERLIAFSNHNIYDSGLITFPGAHVGGCLSHELIAHQPGVRVNTRSNEDEIARVVDLMTQHALRRPDETLGVITMGQYHAGRIEAALRSRLAEERDRELEAFFDESREERTFIKNLERVQGDERDAIILSVGYGKQADGRLPYRFGPLLQQGGERRLNVAVTRARRRLTLVSSFSHTDMDPSRSSAEGVELLRRYLRYAESGGINLDGAEVTTPLNPFEMDVKYRLEQAGLTVIPQYGTSGFRIDFALPHPSLPGRMVLAIEADGASYHSSPTARDRDRLRQQVLERLGWRFHRIWSTDWFNDPQTEVDKVVAACKQALDDIDNRQPAAIDEEDDTEEVVPEFNAPTRQGRRPYILPGGTINDYSQRQLVALARWIKSDTLLRTEDQMIEEMMNELGFQRRGKRIVEALAEAIHRA